jgi:phospholipase C
MARIEHLVVLMLENRSFDNILGWLYPDRAGFDGLRGDESNPWHRDDAAAVERIPVWNAGTLTPEEATVPDPDPGELFEDIAMQIYGLHPDGTARMNGFVDNYMRQSPNGRPPEPRAVMHCFIPEQLPVLTTLARSFGVSDCWFASAPCETWPNRLFAHTGQSGGQVDNAAIPRPFFLTTVFRRLEAHGRSWKVYFHDVPQTAALADLWLRIPTHFRFFDPEFLADAASGALPNYSFIEPRYFTSSLLHHVPNDAHPPHNVAYAERLVADLYNAVRAGPAWDRTLLVIIFDEHGGCYDHVVPPAATPPGRPARNGFAFDRFGPRVAAAPDLLSTLRLEHGAGAHRRGKVLANARGNASNVGASQQSPASVALAGIADRRVGHQCRRPCASREAPPPTKPLAPLIGRSAVAPVSLRRRRRPGEAISVVAARRTCPRSLRRRALRNDTCRHRAA